MHLLPLIVLSGKIASVGQDSTHLLHVPQKSITKGLSYTRSRSVINVAIKKNDPLLGVIRFPFLPIHPRPLFLAQALSRTGAESTNPLPENDPISNCIVDIKVLSLSLITV